jgi:hypothetical protein
MMYLIVLGILVNAVLCAYLVCESNGGLPSKEEFKDYAIEFLKFFGIGLLLLVALAFLFWLGYMGLSELNLIKRG